MKRMPASVVLFIFIGLVGTVRAQLAAPVRPFASNVIIPQSRVLGSGRSLAIRIIGVNVHVGILERIAITTMDIDLQNLSGIRQEGELLMPVPDGAVVKGFAFQGSAREPTAQVLSKEEAKRIYNDTVSKMRDPALLEFTGCNLVRSSVFPIEAHGTQKIRLTFEHLMPGEGNRVDYVLPRTEALDYEVPWNISIKVQCKNPISTAYSPSHNIAVDRISENKILIRTAAEAKNQPGPFQLSFLLGGTDVSASLFAYPDVQIGGGYFLLLAGLPGPSSIATSATAIRRELTLVLDHSGSMSGEKIEQVRKAALQILAGLRDGETFNIIAYNDSVDFFSRQPVPKNDKTLAAGIEYLNRITAQGGTNLYDALQEALRPRPDPNMLPIVLFLTDGQPTVGQTSERAIRQMATKANLFSRRIFTFGVGVDVNSPLLENLATTSRGCPTFILPREDIEVKVSQVSRRLSGPVLADPVLSVEESTTADTPRVGDLVPQKLPDLFEGDQLVLPGRYAGNEPLKFKLTGNYLGKTRSFKFTFSLDNASTKNAFVPRLWASRKIGVLIDAIRQMGADTGTQGPGQLMGPPTPTDPRMKELVDEIVRLSTKFGILTEYTAFLAREGTDLSNRDLIISEASSNFRSRAMMTRSGLGSINQSSNSISLQNQLQLNRRNQFWDPNMNRVTVAAVQQVNDQAFYRRGNRWEDSRIIDQKDKAQPRRTIEFGSREFIELAQRLSRENRQGSISLRGDILLMVDGQPVLIKGAPGK
jgi:Ca-activated chloride channel homolog